MSSLAATQADGYYIPPDYYASGAYEKKSISRHAGSNGHNQFLTNSICRFELPFDGFCTSCDAIIGKGTRFNARKSHVDDYYTTRIYEFATTCRACGGCTFTIRTNPKERTFDYVSGIRRKVEEFDTAEAGTHGIIDTEFGNGILRYEDGKVHGPGVDDAAAAAVTTTSGGSCKLGMLERNVVGRRIAQTEHDRMTSLLTLNSRMGHDSDHNASIRRAFRIDRKAKKRRFGNAATLGLGRGIELLDGTKVEDDEDAMLAKRVMHSRRRDSGNNDLDAIIRSNDRLRDVRVGGIFSSTKSMNEMSSRASSSPLDLMRKNRRGDVDMKYKSHSGQIIIRNRRKKSSPTEDKNTASIDPQKDQSPPQQPMDPTKVERESRHAIKEGSDALALLSSCYDSD